MGLPVVADGFSAGEGGETFETAITAVESFMKQHFVVEFGPAARSRHFHLKKLCYSSAMPKTAPERDSSEAILIIEDEESIRRVLSLALELEGYPVVTAANGREGLDALHRIPRPRLILLDLMMPVLDGWGFLAALRDLPEFATVPVVVLTAFKDTSMPATRLETLQKPVQLENLFALVKKYDELSAAPIRKSG